MTEVSERLHINISNFSGKPIYEQILTQIKAQIIAGELAEGEMLPSMRTLAKELRISVITTKRAYEELEREGFISSVPGKGSFVLRKNMAFIREEQLRQIEEHLTEAIEIAALAGLSETELLEMLATLYKGE